MVHMIFSHAINDMPDHMVVFMRGPRKAALDIKHFSDRRASTDHNIVSFTGSAGPLNWRASRLKIMVARSSSNRAYIFRANILRAGAHRSLPRLISY